MPAVVAKYRDGWLRHHSFGSRSRRSPVARLLPRQARKATGPVIIQGSYRLIASRAKKFWATSRPAVVAQSADGDGLICDLTTASSTRQSRASAGCCRRDRARAEHF